MEVRRTAEALLRGQTGILPFLAPALTRPRVGRSSTISFPRRTTSYAQRQCLSTTSTRRADDDDTKKPYDDDTKKPYDDENVSSTPTDVSDFLNEQLDGTKGVSTTGTGRTSRFKSPTAQAENRHQQPPGDNAPKSASNEVSAAPSSVPFPPRQPAPFASFSPTTSSTSTSTSTSSNKLSISDMLSGFNFNNPGTSRSSMRGKLHEMLEQNPLDPKGNTKIDDTKPRELPPLLSIPLGPSLGRTVQINNVTGTDLGRAFRALDIACARNRVKTDFHRQRFHERPGLKRKRLRSVRWRAKFKDGFRGMVKMIGDMRRQGW